MTVSRATFLGLVGGTRGHFQLESGHHGGLWLDLDGLFADAARIAPFVDRLAAALETYRPEIVCGPLLGGAFLAQLVAQAMALPFCFTQRVPFTEANGLYTARYRLPATFYARVCGKRTAIVDDVVSAGSALRATRSELVSHGATVVVAGALLQLGEVGARLLATDETPMESVVQDDYVLWLAAECPLCKSGVPLEHPASTA